MSRFAASTIEVAALAWLESLGCAVKCGPEIAPGAERSDPNYRDGAQAGARHVAKR